MKQPQTEIQLNIGEAASRSGVSAKMVRHYESLGLLPSVNRTDSGYRQYTETEVHTLRFIKRSRDLGFSMEDIADVLKLWQNRRRSSAEVRRIAAQRLGELDQRILALDSMRRTLEHLIHCCQGDHRPDCPILDELGGELAAAPPTRYPGRRTASRQELRSRSAVTPAEASAKPTKDDRL